MTIDLNTTHIAGNELWRIAALFGVVLVGLIIGKIGRITLMKSASVLETRGREVASACLRAAARSAPILAIAAAFPVGAAFLIMGANVAAVVESVKGVLLSLAIGYALYQSVDVVYVWLGSHTARANSRMDDMLVPIVRTSLRVTVVVLTLLQIAQSLTDKPLTSIIAGLGVGGLAVALAAQDTIKHFFGSVVLFADKPFQVGERIVVDATDGVVEEVGFRSTRIRTLEGYLVTIPNGDLANKTIVNIGKRPHIRHRMILNLTYDTPPDKLKRAIDIVRDLLADHEGMHPDFPPRVYFDEFASASLNLLVMFWYHPADYWNYKAFAERVFFRVLEQFNDEGIDFAFPTQTMYLAGDTKRPLTVQVPNRDSGSSPGDKAP